MSENTRYGLYFALAALGFSVMLVPAMLVLWRQATRPRFSIVGFILAWGIFCGVSAANRLGSPLGAPLPVGTWAEIIRIACAVMTWGIVVEFIVLRSRTPWDGVTERRNGHDRRKGWGPQG